MKRGLIILGLILVFSLSFVSASWFSDLFKKSDAGVTGEVVLTCTDSDDGKNYYKKGVVSGTLYNGDSISESSDRCMIGNSSGQHFVSECQGIDCSIAEWYCYEGELRIYYYWSCPIGCKDGACIGNSHCSGDTCTLYEGETVTQNSHTFEIVFISSSEVKLNVDSETTNSLNKGASQLLEDIKITIKDISVLDYAGGMSWVIFSIEEVNQTTTTCTDSDGGKDYYKKGTIKTSSGVIYTDYCKNSTTTTTAIIEGIYLNEMYCVGDEYTSIEYKCLNGCKDGACVSNQTTVTCTDSDGGKDYYKKGILVYAGNSFKDVCKTVTSSICDSNGCEGNLVDSCEGSNCVVDEYVCDSVSGGVGHSPYYCPNGCEGGACVEDEEICIPKYLCIVEPASCPSSGKQTRNCIDINCNLEDYKENITCNPGECSGCEVDGNCLPYGFRFEYKGENSYCDIDGRVKEQKSPDYQGNWAGCQNNYECDSNLCSSGECIEITQMIQETSRLKDLAVRFFCKVFNPISEDNYNTCISNFLE